MWSGTHYDFILLIDRGKIAIMWSGTHYDLILLSDELQNALP